MSYFGGLLFNILKRMKKSARVCGFVKQIIDYDAFTTICAAYAGVISAPLRP